MTAMTTSAELVHDKSYLGKLVDLQVNGYAGVDFNSDTLSADDLHRACRQLEADGVEKILLTMITDEIPKMAARLQRAARLRQADPVIADRIAGIHIEGPFLNPAKGYIGAHPAAAAKPANLADMESLLEAAGSLTRIVTLAPECDPLGTVTSYLADLGITVAAGHTDASLDQLRAAIDAGLSMFTHLGNGCPGQLPRHDNIIQRALSLADRLTVSFIADGAHVPFFALRNYLRLVPPANIVIVSDTISAGGCGPGTYPLAGQQVTIGADLVPRSPEGHLIGSACPLPRMAVLLRDELGIAAADLHRWLVENPRRILQA